MFPPALRFYIFLPLLISRVRIFSGLSATTCVRVRCAADGTRQQKKQEIPTSSGRGDSPRCSAGLFQLAVGSNLIGRLDPDVSFCLLL